MTQSVSQAYARLQDLSVLSPSLQNMYELSLRIQDLSALSPRLQNISEGFLRLQNISVLSLRLQYRCSFSWTSKPICFSPRLHNISELSL